MASVRRLFKKFLFFIANLHFDIEKDFLRKYITSFLQDISMQLNFLGNYFDYFFRRDEETLAKKLVS